MQKEVIILGAGGHAKVIAESITKSGDLVYGFFDDNESVQGKDVYLGKKVIGKITDIENYKDKWFIIGIGNNKVRKMIAEKYENANWYTAIHPSAVIAKDVEIGDGSVIMPGVVINPGTTIGKHCIINTSVSLDHDNLINDYVHISPGSHLAGTVSIGKCTWIGAGVTVINNITICENSIIGAGATVIKNIEEEGTYVGVPTKKLIKK